MMKGLISAIQFITILPVGKPGTFEPDRMVQYFPVVGLIIGLMLAVFDGVISMIWSQHTASILDVVFLVWITGAFHLDGLGDTADGLYGNRPKEKALVIMKDSRIGAMALAAVVCALAVKWGGISDLNDNRSLILLIIPAYARGAVLFGFRFLDYGRPEGGTGHALFEKRIEFSAFWGVGLVVVLSLFAGWQTIWLNLVFAVTILIILLFYKKRMGCITGDMLGAMTEMTEAVLFLTAAGGMA